MWFKSVREKLAIGRENWATTGREKFCRLLSLSALYTAPKLPYDVHYFRTFIYELCHTSFLTRPYKVRFITELCTVRFGMVQPNIDHYSPYLKNVWTSDKSWEPGMLWKTWKTRNSLSHSLILDMLNNFCFHVYAQKWLFIAENCNEFFFLPPPPHHLVLWV